MAEKRNNPSPNGPITFENRIRELEREASQTRGKIKDLKSAQEKIRNMQIYSKTEEGQDEILRWDEVYEFLKLKKDEELLEALRTRKMTVEQYFKLYYLFSQDVDEENTWNANEWEWSETKKSPKRKKVKIERPSKTLSDLNVEYDKIDWVILPTKRGRRPKWMWGISTASNNETINEYDNKIMLLFSKVLTPANWFTSEDFGIKIWEEPKNMIRRTTYIVVEIPKNNKTIILNNGYWEASFLCDEMFSEEVLTSLTKTELINKYWEKIKRLEFEDEQTWIDQILNWLKIDWKGKAERENSWNITRNSQNVKWGDDLGSDKESREIKEKEATPAELFISLESYIEWKEEEKLAMIDKENIRKIIRELNDKGNYEFFCGMWKRIFLKKPTVKFPVSFEEFLDKIAPIELDEEKLIAILQSNYPKKWESFSWKVKVFDGKYFKHREWCSRYSELWELYSIHNDYLNNYRTLNDEQKKKLIELRKAIYQLEGRIINTFYGHLQMAYHSRDGFVNDIWN